MKIRILELADMNAYRELKLQALQNSPTSFASHYEDELQESQSQFFKNLENRYIFGAFDISGNLIGCAGYYYTNLAKIRHNGTLFRVYVKEEFRGRSIADGLVKAIINHAKPHFTQLLLSCTTINFAALKLYISNGFKIYGTEPNTIKFENKFYDEYLMVRSLTAE